MKHQPPNQMLDAHSRDDWLPIDNAQRHLGLRWQGGSRDTAFVRAENFRADEILRAGESGVALRFPPQSKTRSVIRSGAPIWRLQIFYRLGSNVGRTFARRLAVEFITHFFRQPASAAAR